MEKKRLSIRLYVYVCVIGMALFIATSTIVVSYKLTISQINKHYGSNATDNSKNFASFLDGDFIKEFRLLIESDEYQDIRKQAIEANDESIIENYLKDNGVWDKYTDTRTKLDKYKNNISNIKYLYIVANGDINDTKDMYLIDDFDTDLFEIGMYEDREKEFQGQDLTDLAAPVITNYNWGWLMSDYAPIYDSNGECVGIVGCDLDINRLMRTRKIINVLIILGVSLSTIIFVVINLIILNKKVLNPLQSISEQIKNFDINDKMTLENSNIINIPFKSNNELSDIYDSVRNLQINIINFVQSINTKNEKIRKLDESSHKDPLTKVNNKRAYVEMCKQINDKFNNMDDFDIVLIMADVNNLKMVNDNFGHDMGDEYLKGCCKILCDTFKHSSVYRIGGDEFVILAQNEDFDKRNILYSNLIEQFEQNYNREDKKLYERYSMSLGIAENTDIDNCIEDLFKRADSIMYKNKNKFKKVNN